VARDLYAILGVAHDADFDTIRAAYRNAAKTAHPDLGGTTEEFEALKEAYDCLSDEARRANYDRTGYYTRGKAADTLDAKALDKLRTTIVKIVNLLAKREENKADHLSEADQFSMLVDGTLIEALEWQISKWIGEDRDRLKDYKKEAAKYISIAELFEGNSGKPNRISPLIQITAKYLQNYADAVADEIKVKERSLEILRDHHLKTPKTLKAAQ
jgi:curved DNA-binding protein CbpA